MNPTNPHIIDCDARPHTQLHTADVKEENQLENRVRGLLKWDSSKVRLLLTPWQKKGPRSMVRGNEVLRSLHVSETKVLPASVLEYLLKNPTLIPTEWKGKKVHFWGSIYSCWDRRSVRYIRWDEQDQSWGCWATKFDPGFDENDFIVEV